MTNLAQLVQRILFRYLKANDKIVVKLYKAIKHILYWPDINGYIGNAVLVSKICKIYMFANNG